MKDKILTVYNIGEGLKIENETLKVDSTDEISSGSEKPITSRGAALGIGNLEALLHTV